MMVTRILKESPCIPRTIPKINVCRDLKMMMIKLKICDILPDKYYGSLRNWVTSERMLS